jgi:hypothetical protein
MSVTLESSCSTHTVSVAAPEATAVAAAAATVKLVDTATSRRQRHVKERPYNVGAVSAGWQHFMPAALLCTQEAGYVQQQQQQVTCLVQVQWWLNKPSGGCNGTLLRLCFWYLRSTTRFESLLHISIQQCNDRHCALM